MIPRLVKHKVTNIEHSERIEVIRRSNRPARPVCFVIGADMFTKLSSERNNVKRVQKDCVAPMLKSMKGSI